MSCDGNKIMVFRPTRAEFANFSAYIHKMESQGAHRAGIAKIIPPKGWIPRRNYNTVDVDIPAPIHQVITGTQGLFQLFNVQKKKLSYQEFKTLANSERYKPPKGSDYDELERKYWKNVTFNAPIYAADISGSIFDKDVRDWNVSKLNTILDLIKDKYGVKVEGVNTPYLYFGMWKATFAWHTEDMDLYSINYLHFGAPKTWYAVPPEHGQRLERLAAGFFPGSQQSCSNFLRHKMTIISPQVLKKFSIPFDKVTQEEGQFIVTFPFGYHCGFNHGFNCAESTNFASERWIDFGKKAHVCQCKNDSVKICMDAFVEKYQPDKWEDYLAAKKKEEGSDSESSSEEEDSEDESEEEEDEGTITKNKKKPVAPQKRRTLRRPVKNSKEVVSPLSPRHSKRQPPVTKSVTLPSSRRKLEELNKDSVHLSLSKKRTMSKPQIVDVLDGLWNHQTPSFKTEQAFNVVMAELEPHCSLCQFFSKIKEDLATHLKEELPRTIKSLSDDSLKNNFPASRGRLKPSKPNLPDICFMSEGSSPESMSSLLDNRFSNDAESLLVRCDTCRVVVHQSCYGIDDVTSEKAWNCDRCCQDDEDDIRSAHCCLCGIRGGALKKTVDDRWAHIGCALATPEVVFQDVGHRKDINTEKIPQGRKKLKCSLCHSVSSGLQSACVQCCAGKCATAYHVTCYVLAGNQLEPSDWPQPVETYCERHKRDKFKSKERDFSEISCGESVIAKHKNGRYYKGKVISMTSEEFYIVSFADGSICDTVPPKDIEGYDSRQDDIPEGTMISMKWEDDEMWKARVNGRRINVTYQIQFEDESFLGVRREDVYKEGVELPAKVRQRMSNATETANLSSWDDMPRGAKRRRKTNPRYATTFS